MKHKKTAVFLGFLLVLVLILALPSLVGAVKNSALLAGWDTVKTGYGLSAQGSQYPFASQLYQQAMAAPAGQAGETVEVFVEYDAEGAPLLQEALQTFLEEKGVGDVADWVPVYTYVKPSQSYYAQYSPLLRMYTVALCNTGSGSAYCSAYSIAWEDLALYGIADDPSKVTLIPTAPDNFTEIAQGNAPQGAAKLSVVGCGVVFAKEGAYAIQQEPGSIVGRLAFVRYDTGEVSYPFCTVDGCTHADESCTARMDITSRSLWDIDGTPFLVWSSSDDYRYRGCYLYPDTATRGQEILLPSSGIGTNDVTDGRTLWTVNNEKRLIAVDLADGGRTVLADKKAIWNAAFPDEPYTDSDESLSAGFWPRVIGYNTEGHLLLYCDITFEHGYTNESGEYIYGRQRCRLVTFDPAAQTFGKLLWQYDGDDRWFLTVGGSDVFLINRAEGTILRMDSTTGVQQPVAEGAEIRPNSWPQVVEGYILWDNEYMYPNYSGADYVRWICDPTDGSVKQLTLTAYRKGEQRPIAITDSKNGWLYVNYETVPVTITETVYGQPSSYVSEQHHMGIMRIEDLLADRMQVWKIN